MKRLSNLFKTSFLILLTSSLIAQHLAAQSVYKQARESQITLSGTSTLRDWSMTSTESKCEAAFEIGDDGLPEKLMSLNFIVPFESLKSGNKALDRNAYSTMETEIYKTVTFQLTSATITSTKIQCTGNLSISGTTKPVKLDVEYKISNDNVIACSGSTKLKMSDYNIEPPAFMFGTVQTGDAITINFNIKLTPAK